MKYVTLFILFGFSQLVSASDDVPQDIVTIEENSVKITENEDLAELVLHIKVKEGFFAYKEKFEININSFKTLGLTIDPVVSFFDQTFQKTKEGVRTQATLKMRPQFQGKRVPETLAVDLVYQACTPEYCLFPTTTKITHVLTQEERQILGRSAVMPGWFAKGFLFSFFFVFMAGFLTSLTPCVYPMLPITLAVLGAKKSVSKLDGFLKSFTYVMGMAFTYAFLGVLAATSGFMFGSLMSNSYFLIFLALILFIAALSMFDVFEIQTPSFLTNRLSVSGKSSSFVALFGTGLFSGLIVGPCVGPVLVGILGTVSQTGNILLGFSLLFTFALGLGSLIILAGTFSSVFEKIPRAGSWMIWVKKIIGVAFLALILYFLSPLLKTRDFAIVALFVVFLFSVILLIKDWKSQNLSQIERAIWRSLMAMQLLLAVVFTSMSHERFERLVGYDGADFANTHWALYSEDSLKLAATHQDYVVLDFYAEWCSACRELKHKTFSDPRISAYSDKIKWLYFDSTQSSEQLTALKKKYGILGLPTILFFDKNGMWREDLTLTGFEDADSFLKRLDQLTGVQK